MADDALVRDELAIRRTLAEYCHLCDDGDFPALADRFSADGSFVFGGEVVTGRAHLLTWFETHQNSELRGKHLTLNTVVDLAGDQARALSDFVFLRLADRVPTPAITGRYRDDLIRAGDRWVIARRVVDLMGTNSSDGRRPA